MSVQVKGTGTIGGLDEGLNITGIVTATSFVGGLPITSGADNRVITASSASAIQGEANLTFSGSTLKVNNTTGHSYLKLNSNDSYSGSIHFGDQSDDDAAQIWYDNYQGNGMYLRTSENTPISFYTNNTPRLRLTNGGDLTFLNSNADATADLNSIIFSNNSGEISRIRGQSRNGNTNGMITFHTDISGSSSEKFRINHDGGFCFGTNSTRTAEFTQPDGFSIRWDDKGQFQNSVTSTTCGLLNRKGTDGDILSFRKAGTGVGHIGVNASTMYLNFNASSVAANQLDDYEEGDFTLTAAPSSSGTLTLNSNYNKGVYTKIGNLVKIQAYLSFSGNNNATGYLQLNSLPFTVDSNQPQASGHVRAIQVVYLNGQYAYLPDGAGYYNAQLYCNEGQTWIRIYDLNDKGRRIDTISRHFSAGADVFLNFSYLAA